MMASFAPDEFVEVARDIADLANPTDERYYRTVLNRCYYGTYGTVRAHLESLDAGLFGKRGQHNPLVVALAHSNDPHIIRIGTRLNKLKTWREKADYEYTSVVHRDDAVVALQTAPTLLDRIKKLSQNQWAEILTLAQGWF